MSDTTTDSCDAATAHDTADCDATTPHTWQQIDPTWHRTTDPDRWASVWMDIDHCWHWSVLTPDGQVAGGVVKTLIAAKAEALRALVVDAKNVADGC